MSFVPSALLKCISKSHSLMQSNIGELVESSNGLLYNGVSLYAYWTLGIRCNTL